MPKHWLFGRLWTSITFDSDLRFHFPRWFSETSDRARSTRGVTHTEIRLENTRNTAQIRTKYGLVCRHQKCPPNHNFKHRSPNPLSDVTFWINRPSRAITSGRKYRNTLWKYKKYAPNTAWGARLTNFLLSVTFEPEVGFDFRKKRKLSELNFLNDENST